MGKGRFLYNNLIIAETMLAVSSLRAGYVSEALKEGTGSAIITPSGNYTGSVDKEITVVVDSVAAGAEVGQATFKWSDGQSGWNATGVTTSATDITLIDGIKINFTSGPGDDFVIGDKWTFKAINLFNAGKMIDYERDHRYRSENLESPNTVTVTLESAQEAQALALYDHNLSSGATIVLKGNTADSWASPAFSESIAWNVKKILHFLSTAQTYKYWQLQITDPANPDGFIEIGELFLGPYMELSANYVDGFSEDTEFLKDTNSTRYGIRRHQFYNYRKNFDFDFNYMTPSDIAAMKSLIAAICSRTLGTFKPFYFCRDSNSPEEFDLVEIESLPVKHRARDYYDIPLTLIEVMTSV